MFCFLYCSSFRKGFVWLDPVDLVDCNPKEAGGLEEILPTGQVATLLGRILTRHRESSLLYATKADIFEFQIVIRSVFGAFSSGSRLFDASERCDLG